MKLSLAIALIERETGKELTSIKYEDGSGFKFIYEAFGVFGQKFIDLTNYSITKK